MDELASFQGHRRLPPGTIEQLEAAMARAWAALDAAWARLAAKEAAAGQAAAPRPADGYGLGGGGGDRSTIALP